MIKVTCVNEKQKYNNENQKMVKMRIGESTVQRQGAS